MPDDCCVTMVVFLMVAASLKEAMSFVFWSFGHLAEHLAFKPRFTNIWVLTFGFSII